MDFSVCRFVNKNKKYTIFAMEFRKKLTSGGELPVPGVILRAWGSRNNNNISAMDFRYEDHLSQIDSNYLNKDKIQCKLDIKGFIHQISRGFPPSQTPMQVDLEASPGAVQAPRTDHGTLNSHDHGHSKHLISLIPPCSQQSDYDNKNVLPFYVFLSLSASRYMM